MFRPAVVLGMCLSIWMSAPNAGDIYRCATAAGMTYQDVACDQPGEGRQIEADAKRTDGAPRSDRGPVAALPPCGAKGFARGRALWRRTTLCLGMTDDEVLNLSGWGRPAKIVRTRALREWREDWVYDTPVAAQRALHFLNGALASVEYSRATDTGLRDAVTASSDERSSSPTKFSGSFVATQTP